MSKQLPLSETTQQAHGHSCFSCSGTWTCYDEECQPNGTHKFYWSPRECPECEERNE